MLFAALTSSIALTESAVSTFEDELGWGRKKSTVLIGVIMIALGTLSCLGYGPLSSVTILGMQFLDFFDFLTNSVMMPIAALMACVFVGWIIKPKAIIDEVKSSGPFKAEKMFTVMVKFIAPVLLVVILVAYVAAQFGLFSM